MKSMVRRRSLIAAAYVVATILATQLPFLAT
jgi:hypothetical protein